MRADRARCANARSASAPGVIAQLPQPLEPKLADALEVGVGEVRRRARSRATSARPVSRKRSSVVRLTTVASWPTSTSRSPPMRAMRSEISSAEWPRLPSSSRSAVSDARPCRSADRPTDPPGTSSTVDDDRHRCDARSRARSRPLASVARAMRGKRERARSGPGSAAACDRRGSRDVRPRSAPASARSRSAARHDAERDAGLVDQPAARRPRPCAAAGHRVVARAIGVEVSGIAVEHVVGVQLIGLAAEAADGLQPVDELRFGLRRGRARVRRRSGPPRASSRSASMIAASSSAARRRPRPCRNLEHAGQLARVLIGRRHRSAIRRS